MTPERLSLKRVVSESYEYVEMVIVTSLPILLLKSAWTLILGGRERLT